MHVVWRSILRALTRKQQKYPTARAGARATRGTKNWRRSRAPSATGACPLIKVYGTMDGAWHQGEVSASLTQQAEPPIKKRVRWTEDEAWIFKEAIVMWGSKSNKKIEEIVVTKSTAQVSSYKRRFLRTQSGLLLVTPHRCQRPLTPPSVLVHLQLAHL